MNGYEAMVDFFQQKRIAELEAENAALRADKERLVQALDSLLPGFILDLRHCSEDDDKEALRSRVRTVTEAIDAARKEEPHA